MPDAITTRLRLHRRGFVTSVVALAGASVSLPVLARDTAADRCTSVNLLAEGASDDLFDAPCAACGRVHRR